MEYQERDLTEKIIGAAIEVHIHESQLLTYMRITGCKVGLLINFNKPTLINGVKRFVL
jgi:hypothetical protein